MDTNSVRILHMTAMYIMAHEALDLDMIMDGPASEVWARDLLDCIF